MLDFFTDPYPNELLVSSISRYHHYSGYNSYKKTNRDLFGVEIIKDKYGFKLFSLIKKMIKNLGGSYSLNDFIAQNTLSPYYIITNKMFSNLNNFVLCLNTELFYCPKCVQEDIDNYGEAYFHREHQLRYIPICYKHRTKIIKYKHGVVWSKIDDYHKFDISSINTENIQLLDSPEFDNLHKISKLSYDLLINNNLNSVNSKILSNYYVNKLYQKGFLNTKTATINYYDLKNEITDFYGTNTLVVLNENLDWVYYIDDKNFNNFSVRSHLLLLNFIGLSIDEFVYEINNFKENKTFKYEKEILNIIEAKPNENSEELISTILHKYPHPIDIDVCLKVKSYIKKLKYKEVKLNNSKSKITEFIHSKSEVSKKEIRQLLKTEYDYVYSKDKVWVDLNIPINRQGIYSDELVIYKNNILEFLKLNPNYGRNQVREKLKTEYNYIYRNDKRWIEIYVLTNKQIVVNEKLKKYKKVVEKYVKANPEVGRTKLRETLSAEYKFILKNDKSWIEKYVPSQQQILVNEKLKEYKQKIKEYVQLNPGLGRIKTRQALETEYNYVLRKDKGWIEKHVPIKSRNVCK